MKLFIKIIFFIYDKYKKLNNKIRIFCYQLSGRKPWSKGYSELKWQLIQKTINSAKLIDKFKKNKKLQNKYGIRIDERIIEYPWLMANLPAGPGKLLDAGSTLNYKVLLEHDKLKNKTISIVNLNPESRCYWQKGISYLFTDFRKLSFSDNYFDLITCISSLEHIGMDNTMIYTQNKKFKEQKTKDYLKVITELKRVLKPRGQLFITVPFGQYENFGFLQQFDQKMIDEIIKKFDPKKFFVAYYQYSKKGWNISSKDECKTMRYFNIHQRKSFDADFAAAARAIACLKLIKT